MSTNDLTQNKIQQEGEPAKTSTTIPQEEYVFKFLIQSKRLNGVTWSEFEGKYGTFHSVLGDDHWWLKDIIEKNGNDKGYLFDLNGQYKYKSNGRFINRYTKTKTDYELQEKAMEQMKENVVKQISASSPAVEIGAEQRQQEKVEKWQLAHDENIKYYQEMTRAVDELRKELVPVLKDMVTALRQGGGL